MSNEDFQPFLSFEETPRTTRISQGDEWDVDIRRANKGKRSILRTSPKNKGWLGNPHRITEEEDTKWEICLYCNEKHTRQEAVRLYEELLRAKIRFDPEFMVEFEKLYGKTLKCDCSRKQLCHGDAVIKILEERENNSEGGSPS